MLLMKVLSYVGIGMCLKSFQSMRNAMCISIAQARMPIIYFVKKLVYSLIALLIFLFYVFGLVNIFGWFLQLFNCFLVKDVGIIVPISFEVCSFA